MAAFNGPTRRFDPPTGYTQSGAFNSETPSPDLVNHPPHYTTGPIEVIELIEGFKLNYHLGNVVKYVLRAEHKGNELQDLEKAAWYLNRHIENLKKTP